MQEQRILSLDVARGFAALGDISYSSYLLHFPLQLTFMLATVAIYGFYTVEPFTHWWMVPVFFGALISVSLASFHFLEVPARRWLRSRMMIARPLPAE
jgi:peptidoglycan/LPS O-acetylase OafA/YrhL